MVVKMHGVNQAKGNAQELYRRARNAPPRERRWACVCEKNRYASFLTLTALSPELLIPSRPGFSRIFSF